MDQTEKEKRTTDANKEEKLEEQLINQVETNMGRLSLTVRDADVKDVLMALSKDTPFNIVADPAVEGKVTVDLKDVTLDQALDVILIPLKFTYKVEDNLIKVSKREVDTRIFTLNYVTTGRTGGGSVTAGGTAGGGAGSVSNTDKADLWTDIETELKSLSTSTEGKLSINKMAGIIMVTDYPDVLDRIDKYLKAVESSIHRQVLIQTEIIEVILSNDYQMGLDWSVLTKYFRTVQNLSVGSSLFQVGVASEKFSILLDAFSKQGEMNIISKPEISVLNNQKAVIRIGTEDVYWKVSTEIEPVTGKKTQTTSPQTITVGLVLDVTPQIDEAGSIIMHIHPSVTEKTGESESILGDTMPIIDVRDVDTMVKVENGQTLILGGILRDKITKDVSYVPFISEIPYVGSRLFKRTKLTKQKSELLILLTPVISDYSQRGGSTTHPN